MEQHPLLVILGPTASGKTKLAVRLAEALHGELISADSRQVFRGMDIGTGKDLKEYKINGKQIPYHLINIRAAGEKYNVNEFKEDFYQVFEALTVKKILPVLCGGTGMYVHSIFQDHEYTAIPVNEPLREELRLKDIADLRELLKGYPAVLTQHADLSSFKRLIRAIEIAEYLSHHELVSVKRPLIKPFVVGLTSDVSLRRKRILQRMELRLEEGMIGEVETLLESGVDPEVLTFYGLEYKFVVAYLSGTLSYTELKVQLGTAICQFAKRQMTFFRKMEKDGVVIHWFDTDQDSDQLFSQVLGAYIHRKGL
ncbi:tRNA (adenosine(37)-N6)-dimethylallyltransferase MiaA [Pedobacter steynii]|uniref:tRNA dimethylallyltransferase n=1 Tax=Pedobacter steynii TaxID=430522 RepID=A0A1D7QNT1_9SPHI|nr:tRNA (adenosine(37)-N6)-dimethylallyltransferase MiaA [Pedobacter steynii]AOM80309.1 tRNA (adenosine(37)-N6)-dimethylallyltransferase MiaA [Pedobacter steynii]